MDSEIFNKIEKIFESESDEAPSWANDILNELKEIKKIITQTNKTTKKIDKNYYDFINNLRKTMKAYSTDNYFPRIKYKGRILGINHRGLLYDIATERILPKQEAFQIYYDLYKNKDKLKVIKNI
jgi:hypothetical protein